MPFHLLTFMEKSIYYAVLQMAPIKIAKIEYKMEILRIIFNFALISNMNMLSFILKSSLLQLNLRGTQILLEIKMNLIKTHASVTHVTYKTRWQDGEMVVCDQSVSFRVAYKLFE